MQATVTTKARRLGRSLDSARALLEAERDENTCRLDMKPSEKVAVGLALEELERPKAEKRRTANLPTQSGPGTTLEGGKTRDIVGDAVGPSSVGALVREIAA